MEKLRLLQNRKLIYVLIFITGAMGLDFMFPPPLKKLQNLSYLLCDRNNQLISAMPSLDEKWRLPLTSEPSALFTEMLISFEDKRFFFHPGIDPLALIRAFGQFIRYGKIISGGSTITMQVARLLDPKQRILINKLSQMLRAIQLEFHYSKQDILKFYLILAPYGGNLEGIQAASLAYFKKEADQLTHAEMALLVAIPQFPTATRPHIYPGYAKLQRDKVIKRMMQNNILSLKQANEAINDPVPLKRYPFPTSAPHLIRAFIKEDPNNHVFQTTLDKALQENLESLLLKQVSNFENHQTAAALIVSNKTREILGYVGSAKFLDEQKEGHVDIIKAVRSPGSTLKPFIYAVAFDDGFAHPETLIDDVFTNFQGYTPTNFQDAFHGTLSLRESLQQSLNIPAVVLLEHIGTKRFKDILENLGVHLKLPDKSPIASLPIALGGVGITLFDLTVLYCALANKGEFSPLKIHLNDKTDLKKVFVREAASWYVTRVLENSPVPEGFLDWHTTGKHAVAFKTGTSYGARDAICMGYTDGDSGYTVGVWAGRPDGSASSNQLGRKTAAPILLKIFDTLLLHSCQSAKESLPPKGVIQLPNDLLPATLRHIKKGSPIGIQKNNNTNPIKITFPVDGSTHILRLKTNSQGKIEFYPIPLQIEGGKAPFTWFINDKPEPLHNEKILWQPQKAGFYEIAVVDAEGNSQAITLRFVQ
ncbi:MAG: penicillin-binding protein 1C [Alphaproteobacteria bacterium]|nr:penicillin-binding protein 1C [Alphaproteobacteria bacterium]